MALTEEQSRCREVILSQDYADFVVSYGGNLEVMIEAYDPVCYEVDRQSVCYYSQTAAAGRTAESRCIQL